MLERIYVSEQRTGPASEKTVFNNLLGKINTLKKLIDEEKILTGKYDLLKTTYIEPLMKELKKIKLQQIHRLTRLYDTEIFPKRIHKKLREEILDMGDYMLEHLPLEPEEENQVFNILARHRNTTAENIRRELGQAEGKSDHLPAPKWSDTFRIAGFSLFDFGRDECPGKSFPDPVKTDTLLDKTTRPVRAIYTSLVKLLHPDKEHDEIKKKDKTEAIKRVTEAYEKKDILTLIQLQEIYGQEDDENKLTDSNMKMYNDLLRKQAEHLQKEHLALVVSGPQLSVRNEKSVETVIVQEKRRLSQLLLIEEDLLQKVFADRDRLISYLSEDL